MLKAKNRLLLPTVFLFLVVAIYTSSCKKCNCCGAFITVIDSLGNPISGASVRLDCDPVQNPGCNIDETRITDANGHADFYICNAVLKISVNGTLKGYVMIEEDEGEQKIIQLD